MKIIYENLLNRFTEMCRRILKENLVGVYLHGSAAMGCFYPEKSDLDILIIVKDSISNEEKLEFMQETIKFNEEAPAKGLEWSIVKRAFCNPFVYPTPFELHFSEMHLNWFLEKPEDYVERMNGTDRDLAAHVMILKSYGIVLYGEAVDDVFGEVPREDYFDSIWNDIVSAQEDILNDPMYVILNLCRVLGYLEDGLILSKQTGGEWGIRNVLPKYCGLIELALECYASNKVMAVDTELAVQFVCYMLGEIEKNQDKTIALKYV